MDFTKLSVKQLRGGLDKKEFSAVQLTEFYLRQAEEKNSDLNACLELFNESALAQAKKADEKISAGETGELLGIPVILKDNILYEGHVASAASKILEKHVARSDSGVVDKLKKAGAVILGRSNMDEFAMGSSTENSAFGPTKNPHDLERVPGGSSGGSTAAVAADFAPLALGSDTGGSIRQPAAFCGVVGLKPTYGAVSRSGLIAMASSLDQIGPIAKSVEDVEVLFNAIRGRDDYDNTSRDSSVDAKEVKSLKIGIPKEYFAEGVSEEVRKAVNDVIDFYKAEGFEVKEVSLPNTKYALSAYYIIMPAEVSSNLSRFDGMRYSGDVFPIREGIKLEDVYKKTKSTGFGAETKRRVILGTFVLSSGYYDAYYKKALEVKEYMKDDFDAVFSDVDVLITPTTPTTAFKIGEKADDPMEMYLSDILTIPANLAGIPAISVPVKGAEGLPIGFQIMGRRFEEQNIINLAKFYESK